MAAPASQIATAAAATGASLSSAPLLTAEQARNLSIAWRGDVTPVVVGCCAASDVDLAVATAYGMRAARNLDDSYPYLVEGRDASMVAAAARRLIDDGVVSVFRVAP